MARHNYGVYSASSKGEGHPILIGFTEAERYDPFPDGGGYPKGFLTRAYAALGVTEPELVLHVCSGSVRSGTTVDLRARTGASVVADGRALPFKDCSFPWVLLDPPYSAEYARNLYGTDYPRPGALLREAARVAYWGGRVGMLHFLVPMFRQPLKLLTVYGITCGLGQNIRAFSVFKKTKHATWRNGR